MRTSLSLLALVCGLATAATAQVYVPDNMASGSRNVIPFGGAWPSSSNPNGEFVYQWWIPQSLLGSTPFRIVGVANITSETGVHTATKGELTISHSPAATRSTIFAQNMPSPVTLFGEAPWTWNVTGGQWSPMPMDTGAFFDYNGVDNVTLQVRLSGSKVSLQGATLLNCYNSSTGGATRIYQYGTNTYNATSGRSPTVGYGGKLEFTVATVSITGSGNPSIGGRIDLDLSAPADNGLPYLCASSLGAGPVPLGQRQLGLALDNMFNASVTGVLPQIFSNYQGILDQQGKGQASLNIPSIPLLVGIRIYSAFVTVKQGEPFNLKSISNTFDFSITT